MPVKLLKGTLLVKRGTKDAWIYVPEKHILFRAHKWREELYMVLAQPDRGEFYNGGPDELMSMEEWFKERVDTVAELEVPVYIVEHAVGIEQRLRESARRLAPILKRDLERIVAGEKPEPRVRRPEQVITVGDLRITENDVYRIVDGLMADWIRDIIKKALKK